MAYIQVTVRLPGTEDRITESLWVSPLPRNYDKFKTVGNNVMVKNDKLNDAQSIISYLDALHEQTLVHDVLPTLKKQAGQKWRKATDVERAQYEKMRARLEKLAIAQYERKKKRAEQRKQREIANAKKTLQRYGIDSI